MKTLDLKMSRTCWSQMHYTRKYYFSLTKKRKKKLTHLLKKKKNYFYKDKWDEFRVGGLKFNWEFNEFGINIF